MTSNQWRINLPITKPLSLNDRTHWAKRAEAVRTVRWLAAQAAKREHIPALPKVQIELHYTPKDKRRRDPLNLVATLKAVEDGIVDAGVIPDDTPDYSIPTMPVIDPANSDPTLRSRIYAIIRQAQ